jgi:hypothetical protein
MLYSKEDPFVTILFCCQHKHNNVKIQQIYIKDTHIFYDNDKIMIVHADQTVTDVFHLSQIYSHMSDAI